MVVRSDRVFIRSGTIEELRALKIILTFLLPCASISVCVDDDDDIGLGSAASLLLALVRFAR